MARRDTRKRIGDGIYDDEVNYTATVHVRGAGFREKRFPLGTPLEAVKAWRETERIRLLAAAKRGTLPGTFGRDAERYLKDFTQHLVSKTARKVEVNAWNAIFKDRPRGRITTADVAAARNTWLAQKKSPKTINNRVDTLRHLYRCLDGKRAWTPCDDLEPLDVHKTPIHVVSDDVIAKVDQKLQQLEQQRAIRSPKTRARFRVLVSTGRRPSEVMRTEPGDVDLDRRIWIPRDGKGGFSPGLYLNDDMLPAWRFFAEVNAWGSYDTFEFAQRIRKAGWPKHIRPYQARHTVGITLSERGVDLDDVGSMMGHKRRETTRRHYVPVLNSRMQRASEALEGRFQGWPDVQTTVQNTPSESGKSGPNLTNREADRKPRYGAVKRGISSLKRKG